MNRILGTAIRQALVAGALATPALAIAASGEFSFVTGEVTLTKRDGRSSTPTRGTAVDPGDRIVTGANGMVQLTMVDQARISLRPSSQFVIEQYGQQRDSADGAVLSLLKGTLRTFTGLISGANRDRYIMKTRVASVGIRGSGNILYACEGQECDPSVRGEAGGDGPVAVNHTIEGSHAVTTGERAGTGPTLVTGPGQTVLVLGTQAPRYIPTPRFIADAATNMVNARQSDTVAANSGAAAETRNFSPSDTQALPTAVSTPAPLVGNNGLGFPTIDATANLAQDPLGIRDIVIAAGSPFSGQAVPGDLTLENGALRGYRAYGGGVAPAISGTLREFQVVSTSDVAITLGRYDGATLGFSGAGSGTAVPGSVHFIMAPSGYPLYLTDVLTGTATYSLLAATSPTNQNNTAGSLGSARLDVNFSNRSLNLNANVSMPAASGNGGGQWQLTAENVPIALNSFFGSTNDRLVVTNNLGVSSRTNSNLAGSFEGSFVGTGLGGAILGYSISDASNANPLNWNFLSGVAAFSGPRQNASLPYREVRFSDPNGTPSALILTYAATDRPEEVTSDAQGRVTQFTGIRTALGGSAVYTLGTAQVVESGVDAQTGMVWGRWGNGTAQATRNGQTDPVFLTQSSLHYIVAGTQSGPVTLPLTGTGVYDVIGSTQPTDFNGHVGTLNAATLNANFSARTVDASVNLLINGQTWTGQANGMPIYRDQYFSAYTPVNGLTNLAPLVIGCSPNCGQNAVGSFDGFFTGSSGQRAGLMYRLGPNQGAVAFGRRGG